MPIITLTTDFGSELYAGQMKGVILSINKEAKIIDITHNVKSYNIMEGAFLLREACSRFPAGSIHVGVIDPGVGTSRAGLIIETEKFYFIGPDNGLFSLAIRGQKIKKIIQIDTSKFEEASPTFQGRDIFAPIAAYISLGERIENFGRRTKKIEELKLKENSIIYIDKFGNIITTIQKAFPPGKKITIFYKSRKIRAKFAKTFAQAKRGEFIVLKGSSGYLEIDKNKDSAARDLGAKIGEKIEIY